jgi:hypothetical protein
MTSDYINTVRRCLRGGSVVNIRHPPPSLPRCVAPVPMTSAPRPARCSHAGAVGTAHISLRARRPRPPGCERDARRAHRHRQARQMDRQMIGRISTHDAARRQHEDGRRARVEPIRARVGQGRGSGLSGPSPGARGAFGSRRDRAASRSAAAGPRNAGTPGHRSSSVGRVKSRQLFIAGRRHRPRLAADAVAISPPSVAARWDVPNVSGRHSMPIAVRAQGRHASAPELRVAAAPAGPIPSYPCGRWRSPCHPKGRDAAPVECLGIPMTGGSCGEGLQDFRGRVPELVERRRTVCDCRALTPSLW